MKMGIQHNNSSPALLASRQSVFSSGSSSDSGGGNVDDGGPTTPEELKEMLSDRYYAAQIPCRHYDEIFPGLYLGDMKTARNILTLEKLGVTHILNSAYCPSPFTDKETSEGYYRERNFPCEFMGIAAQDFPSYKISQWFDKATEFIHDGLKCKGNKELTNYPGFQTLCNNHITLFLWDRNCFRSLPSWGVTERDTCHCISHD